MSLSCFFILFNVYKSAFEMRKGVKELMDEDEKEATPDQQLRKSMSDELCGNQYCVSHRPTSSFNL